MMMGENLSNEGSSGNRYCWDVICFIRDWIGVFLALAGRTTELCQTGGITAGMGRGPEWPSQDSNLGPVGLKA